VPLQDQPSWAGLTRSGRLVRPVSPEPVSGGARG
jgi:hypothetical protein